MEVTLEPGALVARVARKCGVNANQVFGWHKLDESGRLGKSVEDMLELLPVRVVEEDAERLKPGSTYSSGIGNDCLWDSF